jgi:hypothetical protein
VSARGWVVCCLAVAAIAAGCGGGGSETTAARRPPAPADQRAEGIVARVAQILDADVGGVAECDEDEPACIRRQASAMAQDARVQERLIVRAAAQRGLSPCMPAVLQAFRAEVRAVERLGQHQAAVAGEAVIAADLARLGRDARRAAGLARACGSEAIAGAALQLHG